jgi:hypothetical protein
LTEIFKGHKIDGIQAQRFAGNGGRLRVLTQHSVIAFWTFRKYIDAFVPRLRLQVASVKRVPLYRDRKARAVLKQFDEVKLSDAVPLEPPIHRVSQVVTRAVRDMDAHMALKCAFVLQMERVEEMRLQEKRFPELITSGDGYNNIAVLTDIAAQLMKLELGNKLMRSVSAITAPTPNIPRDSLISRQR